MLNFYILSAIIHNPKKAAELRGGEMVQLCRFNENMKESLVVANCLHWGKTLDLILSIYSSRYKNPLKSGQES